MLEDRVEALNRDGFVVLPDILSPDEFAELRALEGWPETAAGNRRGLGIPRVRSIAARLSDSAELVRVLGAGAFPLRATLFDKNRDCNWHVAPHQDLTIPVRERRVVPGFGPWSVKDGIPHVRPPRAVLERMLAVRLDIDGSRAGEGALRVIAGSHRRGILDPDELAEVMEAERFVEPEVAPGAALLMHPLIVHASRLMSEASRRRIVHIEFAADELPEGVAWRPIGPEK